MLNILKKNKIEVGVFDYTITLFVKDKKQSRLVYIDYSEYLSSEFFIKATDDGFALIMKCEDEGVEKVLYVFAEEKDAVKALGLLAKAMFKRSVGILSFFKSVIKNAVKIILVLAVLFGIVYLFMMPKSVNVADLSTAQQQGQFRQEVLPEGQAVPLKDVLK